MIRLDRRKAYEIASQWGSWNGVDDPGACFYSFHFEDGRPEDAEHRAACIAYIKDSLVPGLNERIADLPMGHPDRKAAIKDRRELATLSLWFRTCEARDGSRPISDMGAHIPEGVPT